MRVLHVVPVLASRFGGPAINAVESSLAVLDKGVTASVVSTNLACAPSSRPSFLSTPTELPEGVQQLDVTVCKSSWPYRFAYSRELDRVLHQEMAHVDLVHIQAVRAGRVIGGRELILAEIEIEMLGADAGKPIEFVWSYTVSVEDGLITRIRAWYDRTEAAAAAGLI